MRKTLECPKCEGRKIWHLEDVEGLTQVAQGWGKYEQFICDSCGYVELYAKELDRIRDNPAYGVHLIDNEPKSEGPYR